MYIIGFFPIFVYKYDILNFTKKIKTYTNVPISRNLLLDILGEYKSPNDKISELLKSGELISIRRGLYAPGPQTELPTPAPFLIANHLRGPSYVSLETALSYWGLIPERTFEISSVCIQSSKKYHTALGRFTFQQVSLPYYAFGIQNVQISNEQTALISTPEKAICDKIILTAGINLRSRKQTALFLLEDLRMDITMLRNLDTSIMKTWLPDAPKKSSLRMLISTLEEL